MRKKPKQEIYRKFSITDTIVVIMSIIVFVALIFVIKNYYDKSRVDQEKLAATGSIYHGEKNDKSLDEMQMFITINEVNQAGWIELYNKESKEDIDLSNCYITVNGIQKYTFTKKDVIEAGKFLCIDGLGQLGATENDIIGIYKENGENLKNIIIPNMKSKESYGCKTDGDISYCFMSASKQKSNAQSNVIKKEELTFSVPGGFYDERFNLEITASDGMTIYYTLDGSEPTNKSKVYNEPILIENKSGSNMHYATAEGIDSYYQPSSISMGMVVRAFAVGKGKSSEIKTQSYFIGLKNASDLVNLPVFSIVTSPNDFFDYFSGIYVSGRSHEDALARGEEGYGAANYLNGWERNVSIEYFEPKKDKTYEGNMIISILKDDSVGSPQKSLLLTAEGGAFAGSSLINYFNNKSCRLVLVTNGFDNDYKIREYLAGKLLVDTTVSTPDIMPCIVFLDGEYWGGYMVRAEYDEKYIEKRYDVDESKVLIVENGSIINKTGYQEEYDELYDFIVGNDLKDDENYGWVEKHLDIHNYLEYFCANMYLANAEYGRDKLVMWRTINENGTGYEDGKWRFLMPRLDNTMDNGKTNDITTSSVNTFLQEGATQDKFFQSLCRNDEFRNQLDVVMKEMADKTFTSERVNSAISGISKQMKKMVETSYRRFFGYPGALYYTYEVEKVESFFEKRRRYILKYTDEIKSQ